jgi:hypothetical protein
MAYQRRQQDIWFWVIYVERISSLDTERIDFVFLKDLFRGNNTVTDNRSADPNRYCEFE